MGSWVLPITLSALCVVKFSIFTGKMAIKKLIALCLVFAVTFVHALPEAAPEAEAEAEADADAWYGYYGGPGGFGYGHGYGYGHGLGYGGYRPFGYGHHYHHRRPYHYKPRPVAEVNHLAPIRAPIAKTYGYRTLPEASVAPAPAPEPAYLRHPEPIEVPEPEPVVAPRPEPEVRSAPSVPVHPVFLSPEERSLYAAFMPVPAVPEGHIVSAPAFMTAPTLPPAPISRAAEIVPVFDNDVVPAPEEEPTEQMKENMAALQSIFKMLKSFPAVPEDHFLQNGV